MKILDGLNTERKIENIVNKRDLEISEYNYTLNKYPRIFEHRDKILDLPDRMDECFTIDHFHLGVRVFEKIAEIAKENGFEHVYDIGCAYGMAAEVYSMSGLKYHGIEIRKSDNMWDRDKHEYIFGDFLKLDLKPNLKSCAVSVLCLGWSCYIRDKSELEMQIKKLADNFPQAILYCENNQFIDKYYSKYDVYDIDQNEGLGRIIHLKEKRS